MNKRAGKQARLNKALELVGRAWDVLEPGDLSETRMGELQRVWVALTASLEGLKRAKAKPRKKARK